MTPWRYEPAVDLDQSMVERLRRFPREPDMLVYGFRSLVAIILRGWLRLYHRLQIDGVNNLPVEGFLHSAWPTMPVILIRSACWPRCRCANCIAPSPPRPGIIFLSACRAWRWPRSCVNALPFARQKQIRQSLELCRQLLANPGNILILFPEGTRTATGQMGEFKPGIGLLAAGTRIPGRSLPSDGRI